MKFFDCFKSKTNSQAPQQAVATNAPVKPPLQPCDAPLALSPNITPAAKPK